MSDRYQPSDLARADLDAIDVTARYSEFAPVYDQSVSDWGYRCWQTVAEALAQHVPTDQPVLDAGCGTGLVGKALSGLGYRNLTGIDISADMLIHAEQSYCYRELRSQDLCQTPYPFSADSFAAVACVGVFSLIADPRPVLAEFHRLIRPDGWLIFTQQELLYHQYGYPEVLAEFERQGALRRMLMSKPEVYLPKREGFTDRKVIYFIYQNLKP